MSDLFAHKLFLYENINYKNYIIKNFQFLNNLFNYSLEEILSWTIVIRYEFTRGPSEF